MMLLKAEVMLREGKNPASLQLLLKIRSRLSVGEVPERVSLLSMMAKAYHNEGKIDDAIENYREALSLADANPQLIDVAHRITLTSALARTLFAQGAYKSALARFRQAGLLMNHHENIAELLYWQSLCYARLGRQKKLDEIIRTLKSHYQGSDWTSLAISNLKDYQWKKGNRNLQ